CHGRASAPRPEGPHAGGFRARVRYRQPTTGSPKSGSLKCQDQNVSQQLGENMKSAAAKSLVAFGALLLTLGSACAKDVLVAVAGPFTGQLAALGEQLKRGAEQFVADQNAKGGVLGRKLVLQEGDDQCDPRQAVAVANQFATKQVAVVIGHACSGSSIPAS